MGDSLVYLLAILEANFDLNNDDLCLKEPLLFLAEEESLALWNLDWSFYLVLYGDIYCELLLIIIAVELFPLLMAGGIDDAS